MITVIDFPKRELICGFVELCYCNSIADCLKRTSCRGSNICQGRQQRAIIYNDYMCTQDKLNSVLSFVQSNELIRLVAKSLELAIILIDSTMCFVLAW